MELVMELLLLFLVYRDNSLCNTFIFISDIVILFPDDSV
jgi:hypothetical protein